MGLTSTHTPRINMRAAGMKACPTRSFMSSDLLYLFLTIKFLATVNEQNKYTQLLLQGHVNAFPDSRKRRWKNFILGELDQTYCLFAAHILSSGNQKVASCWYPRKSQTISWD
jgi:hypothetical protein